MSNAPERRGPGGPRSAKARDAVLRTAWELLEEGGLGAVTMERLAQRSGVGKPTIYRTWANREEVAMAALMLRAPANDTGEGGSALDGLKRQMLAIMSLFSSRMGRNIARMLAAADSDTEIARSFRSHFLQSRRKEGRDLLLAAIAGGELQAGFDIETALDLLYGAVFYRLLAGHEPLTEAFAKEAVRLLTAGLGAPRETEA